LRPDPYATVTFKSPREVASETREIMARRPDVQDVFLTQDSYSRRHLQETAAEIGRQCGTAPYSLMLRAEPWVREDIGAALASTGCTDAFIGAEGLDDEILGILNKGLTTNDIVNAVQALSRFVNVTIGMILFVPGVSHRAMSAQLRALEQLIPHVAGIELEVLTVVNGSEFARNPSRYGIVLNATENVINDSWCFGLSQDIPWTMADTGQIRTWIEHIKDLRGVCSHHVPQPSWDSIDELIADLC